jgi:microsomal dipeptidase-like Zn-dependent dipeptidase
MRPPFTRLCALLLGLLPALAVLPLSGCGDDPKATPDPTDTSASAPDTAAADDTEGDSPDADLPPLTRLPAPPYGGPYAFAHACVMMDASAPDGGALGYVLADDTGDGFRLNGRDPQGASRLRMQPSDLGAYLLYDAHGHYLAATTSPDDAGSPYPRPATLESDISRVDDSFQSPAEWAPEPSPHDPTRLQLRHLATNLYLGLDGLRPSAEAAIITLYPADGCATFPELTLDAEGTPHSQPWDDGAAFGIVDAHAHLFTNFAFGGGGIFHGAPFHRLGVEHALSSCERFHGAGGRRDIVGFAIGNSNPSADDLVTTLATGRTPDFNHHTDGYPTFTDWPNSWRSLTHQAMYYRWLQRAWMGGLRLLVQHATGNSVLCELVVGSRWQRVRYACNDMVSVDRQIAETYNLERYIDALSGGPGQGWFRVVTTPAQAREVIAQGKLAVLLGIEISNIFDCTLTPEDGASPCTAQTIRDKLDAYHALGVRVIFPVHKYDNAFSAGDGQRGIIEIGNFINSGHWSNLTDDCPSVTTVFDKGGVQFPGINQPREDYLSPPPNDLSGFFNAPFSTLINYASQLTTPPQAGEFCQNAGLTELGESFMHALMRRGMIIDIDHLPQRAVVRALELLTAADYPVSSTHGNNHGGQVYALGGISNVNLGRCADPNSPGSMAHALRDRVALSASLGGYPAEGFGFDFNGLAHGPRPRFGDNSRCRTPQENPITYPFTAYGGGVTFTAPSLGVRAVDFNTEGMLHIGLMPELIEDARRDGVTDEDLAPLFRSAEGYLRMWERAEARGAQIP